MAGTSIQFASSAGSPRVEWTSGLPNMVYGWTMMALVRITSYGNNGFPFSLESAGGAQSLTLYTTTTAGTSLVYYSNTVADTNLYTWQESRWAWLIYVYEPGTTNRIRVYVKFHGGELVRMVDEASLASFTPTSVNLSYDPGTIIGNNGTATIQYASVKMWNRALSVSELKRETFSRRMVTRTRAWFANDCTGDPTSIKVDQSGAGHLGTLTGTPTLIGDAPNLPARDMPLAIYLSTSGTTGTGSAAESPFDASGTGAETFTGTGSAAEQSFAATGSGAETFTGTASAATQPFAATAAGAVVAFFGTATAAVASFAASSSGTETFTGTGSAAEQPFASSAAGAETFSGSGSAAEQPFDTTGTGAVGSGLTGTASAAVSPFAAAGAGAETFSGAGSAAAQPYAASGTGAETFTGTGSAAAQPFGATGSGTESFIATAAAAVASFAVDAAGMVVGIIGSAVAAVASFGASGSGAETFTGDGSAGAAPFGADGAGDVPVVAAPVTSPWAKIMKPRYARWRRRRDGIV